MAPESKIAAVVVAYRPDIPLLEDTLAAIAPQVMGVLLIANDGGAWDCRLPSNVTFDRQKGNVGLGAAYNLAVSWARRQDASHLLLLDQDSVAAPDMVAKLMQALESQPRAAAAGPLWRDRRTGKDGFFVRLSRFGARKHMPSPPETAPVDFLISSGSLIALDTLADIGGFDADLFIEHVDTDWSLRARAKGYTLLGVAAARLDHSLGEETMTSVFAGRRSFFCHPPERQYHLLRNSLILWRRPYAPRAWVLHDTRRILLLMSYYLLFVPPRLIRLKSMMRAIRAAFAAAPPT